MKTKEKGRKEKTDTKPLSENSLVVTTAPSSKEFVIQLDPLA